jgi:hypothetical protein
VVSRVTGSTIAGAAAAAGGVGVPTGLAGPGVAKRGIGAPCTGSVGNAGAAGLGVAGVCSYETTGCGIVGKAGGAGAAARLGTCGAVAGCNVGISSGALASNFAVFSGGMSQPDLDGAGDGEAGGGTGAAGVCAAAVSGFGPVVDRSLSLRARADFCCCRFRR